MATANQRLGKAFIRVDGALLESMPGAKIDLGGEVREPVVGSNAVLGYASKFKEATLECEISLGPNTNLDALRAIADSTITFECDTGQTWLIRNAWLAEPPVLSEGEGGKVPLKFVGPPAVSTSGSTVGDAGGTII